MIQLVKHRLSIQLHISLLAGICLCLPAAATTTPPLGADTPHADQPIVDSDQWTVSGKKHSVTLTPMLQSPVGYAHVYQKKLAIEGPVIALVHSPKNPGTHAITTKVYDHDFLIFDGHTISEGRTIRFPFKPEPQTPLGDADEIHGSNIIYKEEIKPKQTVADDLKDYSANAADYHFTVEDTKTKVGVEQSSDSPISSFYLWSIRSTVSPEASIHLDVASGKTGHWKINYRFFAPPSQP